MKLQVLVSTMHQDDHSIIKKMNIKSDAIIVNQCNKNVYEDFNYLDNKIRFLSLAERGVGLSRNTALMRATADICLFADDDILYDDSYMDMIINEFANNSKADVIIFNLNSSDSKRGNQITESRRLRFYNIFKYGAPQIAIRLDAIRESNIHFSLLFGGGAKYSSGEDSLFLSDCLKKGLKIYSSTKTIGSISFQESSWFNGYTDKYFIDKGRLYAKLSSRAAKLLCLRFAFKHRKKFENEKGWLKALKLMTKGVEENKR